MKAIILGASGMVGEGVLLTALKDDRVDSVLVIGRRPCGVKHEKINEIIHKDFLNLNPISEKLRGYNACFFCMGVSSVGMDKKDYEKITYDLTMHWGDVLSKNNDDLTFCYVSGAGTDSSEKGKLHWARIKGKTENDLMKFPFKAVFNFRPGFMKPVEGQRNIKNLYKAFLWMYPFFKAIYPNAGCKLEEVGMAMINISLNGFNKHILDNSDIEKAAACVQN